MNTFHATAPRTLLTLASAAMALAAMRPAAAEPLYTLTYIGSLGGTESRAMDVNESGHVAGWSTTANNALRRGFFWSAVNGFTVLNPMVPGPNSPFVMTEAYALSDDNRVIGRNASSRGVYWDASPSSNAPIVGVNLGSLGYPNTNDGTTAYDVSGTRIVGVSQTASPGVVSATVQASVRPGTPGAMTGLAPLPRFPGYGVAYGVSDNGWVSGSSRNTSEFTRAVRWSSSGTLEDLGNLNGYDLSGYGYAQGEAVNNAGTVVGGSFAIVRCPGGDSIATKAFASVGGAPVADLMPGQCVTSNAFDINNAGAIVGTVNDRAVVWSGPGGATVFLDASTVVNMGNFSQLQVAAGINESGQIVGWGQELVVVDGITYGFERSFLLTPIPEPATWALWLTGMAVLGAAARRRQAF